MVCPLMTHKRHWLCTAAMVLMPVLAPIKVPTWPDTMPSPEFGGEYATARVHHTDWRHGYDVAARGARAAAGSYAPHRCVCRHQGRRGRTGTHRGFPAGAAA